MVTRGSGCSKVWGLVGNDDCNFAMHILREVSFTNLTGKNFSNVGAGFFAAGPSQTPENIFNVLKSQKRPKIFSGHLS